MVKQLANKVLQVIVFLNVQWVTQSVRSRVDIWDEITNETNNKRNRDGNVGNKGGKGSQQGGYPNLDKDSPNIGSVGKLVLGQKGGPLIPSLVVPPGSKYVFTNKEKRSFFARNDYTWILKKQCSGQYCKESEEKLMKAEGGFTSNAFGRRLVEVSDTNGNRLFDFRMNRFRWNPFQLHNTFRVFPPGVTDLDQCLFTINRDVFGKGFLWIRWEWRIYIGRQRAGQPAYYVLEKYKSALGRFYTQTGAFKIYKSQEDQETKKPPVALLDKEISIKGIFGDAFGAGDLIPDKYKITVHEGQDSALLLVLATIIDMFSDAVQSKQSGRGGVFMSLMENRSNHSNLSVSSDAQH